MSVIISARDPIEVAPPNSGRRYIIQALTFRERAQLEAALAREGATVVYPGQIAAARRDALEQIAPPNKAELLALLAEAEAPAEGPDTPEQRALGARLAVLDAAIAEVPGFAAIMARNALRIGLIPFHAAAIGLRDWEGEGLPPFARTRGLVPAELLEQLPDDELAMVGWRVWNTARVSAVQEKNSAGLSPSPESPTGTSAA